MDEDVQRRLAALESVVFGVNGSVGMRMQVRDLELGMKTINDERRDEKEAHKNDERFRRGIAATVIGALIIAAFFQVVAALKASATQSIIENAVKQLDATAKEIKASEG